MFRSNLFYVYILECADESFYTGMTNWLERRITEHETGIIETCYTHGRRPLKLVHCECYQYVWNAIIRETQIKTWSRAKKIALINGDFTTLKNLSSCKNPSHHSNHRIDRSILSRKLLKSGAIHEFNLLMRAKSKSTSPSQNNTAALFLKKFRYPGCNAPSSSDETTLSARAPRFLVRPRGVEGDKMESRADKELNPNLTGNWKQGTRNLLNNPGTFQHSDPVPNITFEFRPLTP